MFQFLMVAVIAGVQIAHDPGANASQTDAALEPASYVRILPGDVHRASDGLFYVTGLVNGVPVRFLVDTGASSIVLTREDAVRAGVLRLNSTFSASADTANGRAQVAWTNIGELEVGPVRTNNIPAAVVADGLGVSLLGQSWLSQLASVTITGDRMLLRN